MAPAPTPGRDARLDALRGLALVMIYINHLPGNAWQGLTSRNFGQSDAAEGFVLIAGIAAALAYGKWFARGAGIRTMLAGVRHVGRRGWQIYLVQILITVLVLGAIAALAGWFDDSTLLRHNQMPAFIADPAGAMIRIPLLLQQLDYVDILPMYLVLLGFAPAALWLGLRAPLVLLVLSAALWGATGAFRLNLPSHPNPGGWFFNPLAWQLLFVIGLLAGLAWRDGRRLVPRHPLVLALALAVLAFGLVWQQGRPLRDWLYGQFWLAGQTGVPHYLVSFDKTYLPLPRLLHVLILAYALGSIDLVRRACGSALAAPFRLLGRQGLLVFATGSVLCVALQTLRLRIGPEVVSGPLMVGGGLALVLALAALREVWPRRDRPPLATD
jgi:hypothetical protein